MKTGLVFCFSLPLPVTTTITSPTADTTHRPYIRTTKKKYRWTNHPDNILDSIPEEYTTLERFSWFNDY